MIDPQTLLNMVLGGALACLGWFAKELWDAVQSLRADLSKLREELAKDYSPKADLVVFKEELFSMLHRIEDKLDRKVDK